MKPTTEIKVPSNSMNDRGKRNRIAPVSAWVAMIKRRSAPVGLLIGIALFWAGAARSAPPTEFQPPEVLPGTERLENPPALFSEWTAWLDKEIRRVVEERPSKWAHDTSSHDQYLKSVEPMRSRFAALLGIPPEVFKVDPPEEIIELGENPILGAGAGYTIRAVRWPVEGDLAGEGLLLVPAGKKSPAKIVVIPDAAQTPEQCVGLDPGVPPASQVARKFAEAGVTVLVPRLVDRGVQRRGQEGWRSYSRQELTNRDFLYRPGFQLGRHLIGTELRMISAAAAWLDAEGNAGVGVFGWGEGGLLALYSAALDPHFKVAGVSGYFRKDRLLYREPLDRNVFNLVRWFGDAEIASLILPRTLLIEAAPGPEGTVVSPGGSTGILSSPKPEEVRAEFGRLVAISGGLKPRPRLEFFDSERPGDDAVLTAFLDALGLDVKLTDPGQIPTYQRRGWDGAARQAIHHHQIDRYYQWLLGESSHMRRAFMKDLNTESIDAYVKSVKPYREHCRSEILGVFPNSLFVAPRPRTRVVHRAATWTAYELVLDVFSGTHSYGYLNLPNDLQPGDRRPVVFCQHGGGGNPQLVTVGDDPTYKGFAGKLAERGFITYAPSSLYSDNIVRPCNVIGKTQYSVIAAQYQQVIRWLKSLPTVNPDRIGLYGLSWGGKTAMRLPILVPDFSLTICSGDFNEWIAKTASSRDEVSYVFQPEPYIFEWNLGTTYGYAEMAALIAPRPFMVERGHDDPVGTDDWVGLEFAKVRHLYAARLKLPDRCAIDWFDGGHEIHGVESFRFLHRHLNWPETKK